MPARERRMLTCSIVRFLRGPEAHNAMARAVCFNKLSEIRDRSFENQRHRASGLNLIVAAITLWTTVYLERAASLSGKVPPAGPVLVSARISSRLGARQPHGRLHMALK